MLLCEQEGQGRSRHRVCGWRVGECWKLVSIMRENTETIDRYVTTGHVGVSLQFDLHVPLLLVGFMLVNLLCCCWDTGFGRVLVILAIFALRKPAVEVTAGETTRVGMHILIFILQLSCQKVLPGSEFMSWIRSSLLCFVGGQSLLPPP